MTPTPDFEHEAIDPWPEHTLEQLEALPTRSQGQADDLKVEDARNEQGRPTRRVWLSRCTVEDGEPCNNKVTVERLEGGAWIEAAIFEAMPDEDPEQTFRDALVEIAAGVPLEDEWRSSADFMEHAAGVIRDAGIRAPDHYEFD